MTEVKKIRLAPALFGILLAAGLFLLGCGVQDQLVSPEAASPAAGTLGQDLLADPGQRPLSTLSEDIEWLLVGSGWVTPTQPIKVKGSRYTLKFDAGSVAEDVLVTIHERDPQIADVEFGPDGTQFLCPVEVTIDYKGTVVDPESEDFNGAEPRAYWYDPTTEEWVEIPSIADKELKKVTFTVTPSSRYGVGVVTETLESDDEWQWIKPGKKPKDAINY